MTAIKEHEPTVDNKQYMSDVGSLRFIADTTHPDISHIVGLLGGHLHNPSQRHVDALKPIYRYLASRSGNGPAYNKRSPLEFTCYTDSDYAACKDTRRSISGNLLMANGMLIMWGSALQSAPTHSTTEVEYIYADTGARNLTWISNLTDELLIPMQK